MTTSPLNYMAGPGRRWIRRPGYLILVLGNGLLGMLAVPMIVSGCTSVADGWGGLGVFMMDAGLLAAQLLALLITIIYAAVQAKRNPVRVGRPLTWLLVESFAVLALGATAATVFMMVPHKVAC